MSHAARLARAACWCAVACALARSQPTRAQTAATNGAQSTVLVGTAQCNPARYDADALWKALQVELAVLGVHPERVPSNAAAAELAASSTLATVAIDCGSEPDQLVLRIDDAASGKELTRTLSVADIAATARARALALAVSALLESSWAEVVSPANETPEREALPVAVESAVRKRLARKLEKPEAPEPNDSTFAYEKHPTPPPKNMFEIAAALRSFPGRGTGLLGVDLAVLHSVAAATRIVFTGEALFGRSDLSDVNGKLGVMGLYWFTAGGGLSFHTDSRPEVECGPRVLIGYGLADAHATRAGASAKNGSGLVVSALLEASLRAHLGAIQVMTGADIGYTVAGVVFLGDEARLSGMADTTFALRTGISW